MGNCATKAPNEHSYRTEDIHPRQPNRSSKSSISNKEYVSSPRLSNGKTDKLNISQRGVDDIIICSYSDDNNVDHRRNKSGMLGTNGTNGSKSDMHKEISSIQSMNHMVEISSNQFGMDSLDTASNSHSASAHNNHTKILRINQFDKLKKINDQKLLKILQKEQIIFDSLLQIYPDNDMIHHANNIDVAAILTKNNMYLVSATNYRLYQLFVNRTKIDELVGDDIKIDDKMAKQLTENLNLVNDDKLNDKITGFMKHNTKKTIKLNILFHDTKDPSLSTLFQLTESVYDDLSYSASLSTAKLEDCDIWLKFKEETNIDDIIEENIRIDENLADTLIYYNDHDEKENSMDMKEYLIGKTKREIKRNMTSNNHKITSLNSLYQLKELKNTKYIIIHHFYVKSIIERNKRDELLDYVLNGINWIEQSREHKSIIIELEQYHCHSIINLLSERKNEYFAINNLCNCFKIKIAGYKHQEILNSRSESKIINLKKFNNIELYNEEDAENGDGFKFAFKLINGDDNDNIIFLCNNNNIRHQWMTHIDYVNYICCKSKRSLFSKTRKAKKSIDKLMNDFTNDDDVKTDEFSNDFSFGEYLNYWEYQYDNSVIPKYDTLKQELLENKIATISEKDYAWLYDESQKLMKLKGYTLKAKHIGVNNKLFGIPKGTHITINHLITLKLYTDFSNTQKQFKKHCRKYNNDESMNDFIERHSEIAHWARYLKECCQFYGNVMNKNMIVYTGLKNKLMFDSMKQHYMCPLSTTMCINIAQSFCDDHGIILKLKAANNKTRFFDVSWLSQFPHEKERLFMGSSLQICDIYINGDSNKKYISAIQMFEQIINGQFNDSIKYKTEMELYMILTSILKLNDVGIPQYVLKLFMNMIQRMKKQNELNQLWINKYELNKIQHKELKCLLIGCGEFFKYFNIEMSTIKQIQRFIWKIDGEKYNIFKNKKFNKYIKSQNYEYIIDDNEKIIFYLTCCAQYSYESKKCALFLYLEKLPKHIKEIQIEYNLLCDKKPKYSHLATPQWLSMERPYCGFQTFPSKSLNRNISITWNIAMKITDIKYNGTDLDDIKEYEDDLDIDNFETALETNNKEDMLEMFKSLVHQNNALKMENQQLKHLPALSIYSGNSDVTACDETI